ncbi:MAG: hypothetical protein ACXITV_07290 [Luteibaculaceae bacterium]
MKLTKTQIVSFVIAFVVAAVTIIIISTRDRYSTLDEKSRDFAVKDTARITKIFIHNTITDETVLLERETQSLWRYNGEHRARDNSKDLLLKTIFNMEVKRPASPSASEGLYRRMAGNHTKVEIYMDGKDIPEKTIFMGPPNNAHSGTYMLLETPKHGRFNQIYDVHMPGHRGFLNPIFFTFNEDWIYPRIYDYKNLEFKKIDVRFKDYPEDEYSIEFGGGNNIKLFDPRLDTYVDDFDTLVVKDYLLFYKKVSWSKIAKVSGATRDSILNSAPFASISVTENSGEVKTIELFFIPWEEDDIDETDDFGRPAFAKDNYYGWVNKEELVVVQTFTFNNLLVPKNFFYKDANRVRY